MPSAIPAIIPAAMNNPKAIPEMISTHLPTVNSAGNIAKNNNAKMIKPKVPNSKLIMQHHAPQLSSIGAFSQLSLKQYYFLPFIILNLPVTRNNYLTDAN